ncbi:MAG: beta-N-acetylhexosaminidase [Chitinophagaceae bacterium]
MKHFILFSFLISPFINSFSQSNTSVSIVPQPVSMQIGKGNFILKPTSVIELSATDTDAKRVAGFLSKKISTATGYAIPVEFVSESSNSSGNIRLSLLNDGALGTEGYKLNVSSGLVMITANKPAGLFYGMQTLLQLLPKEIESKTAVQNISWGMPAVSITDYPRFGWRGIMFDVARHFFGKKDIEGYIDQMVRYKFNLLHLGLTNDEGRRIEIKGLPKLTDVGAWNVKREGYFGTFQPPAPDEPRNFGGFYTQEDIRELVQYAKDRFVNILPEINMPGHSLAAIAAYPELSCSGIAGNPRVSSGEKIKDWAPKHVALVDDNLCPAKEIVYEFADKVITEVAKLFPFEYIHMGGDETFKTFWEKSPEIAKLMKKEGLKNMEEVQSYFGKRIQKIVESKGKKFMGWDEILEGGLAPNAVVMSWRGMKGGIEAAKMGHEVVMSPTTFAYLDYMQGDPIVEPHVYATLRLNKAYQFEPVPEGVDPKYIKGGQANLWTEQIYNMRHAEYMTWPRGMAISESVWSPKEKKNWDDFTNRVEKQFGRLDIAEIKYSPSMYDAIFTVNKTPDNQLKIQLSTEVNGLDIYYSFDNTFPDRFYPKYSSPLIVPKESVMLKVITYKGKQPVGRMIAMPIEELQKRAKGKKSE